MLTTYNHIFEKIYNNAKSLKRLQLLVLENKKLNSYKYGYPYKPDLISIDREADYYTSLTTEELDKFQMGNCWDFTHYYCKWADEHNMRHYGIFMAAFSEKGNLVETHAFPVIKIDDQNFWAESAWQDYKGLYEFNTRTDLISYAFGLWSKKVIGNYDDKIDFAIWKYQAELLKYESIDADEFIKQICWNDGVEIDESRLLAKVKPINKWNIDSFN